VKTRPLSTSIGFVMASLLALSMVLPGISGASTYTIDTDFDPLGPMDLGTVTDNGNNLAFAISLNTAILGPNADLRDFWFNLSSNISSIAILNSSAAFTSSLNFNGVGPAGNNKFDVLVNFGNGRPFYSNVSFTLSADRALDICDISFVSAGSSGGYYFGIHAQSTIYGGQTSEKAGTTSLVPIPGTLWLLGPGLLGLMALRRNPKQT
jgi:hypothetical protein